MGTMLFYLFVLDGRVAGMLVASMSTVTHVPDGGAGLVRKTTSNKVPELNAPPYALGVTLQATGGLPSLTMPPDIWMLAAAARQGRAAGSCCHAGRAGAGRRRVASGLMC